MKQVIQSLRTGVVEVADAPSPAAEPQYLVIRTRRSLVSAGTERMLVQFGKAGWIEKARQQPDRVRQALQKARTDGLVPTLEAVLNKLDQPLAMGYCNAGLVLEAGAGVAGFAAGDRVVSNGKHAEVVSVPATLCAKIPDGVSDEEAAFAVLGAVALQGIRLTQPSLGETVAVSGLGLVGLLAVQLLRSHGCRVLGLDMDPLRLEMARSFGAQIVDLSAETDPVSAAMAFSRGRGMDAVIIAASTESSEPVRQAARMCRKRGRIVLVGVTGLDLSRADFYEKELTFQVSCSYGPGRHDVNFEEKGQDYPVGFVRWTAQRNFEAVLDMMADRRVDVRPLISHRFPIERAQDAYALIASSAPSLGIIIEYAGPQEKPDIAVRARTMTVSERSAERGRPAVAFLGAGSYATGVLIPAFVGAGARLKSVASLGSASSLNAARKFGFEQATTDVDTVLGDPDVKVVVIATRHDSHARLASLALSAGKHVFVEKPLAIDRSELSRLDALYTNLSSARRAPILMVGFNRRFAPHVRKAKQLLAATPTPKAFVMTVNAGTLPREHWTRDPGVGGGRIIGECCHFIDLLRFLAGAALVDCRATPLASDGDSATITLSFADGSLGTVHYFTNGSRAFPKERLEVFAGEAVLQLLNFRRLVGYGWPRFSSMGLWRQDKGQRDCVAAFLQAVEQDGPPPIPAQELFEVSEATLRAAEMLRC